MRLIDILYTVVILILFGITFIIMQFIQYIKSLQANWKEEQCDPRSIMLADFFGLNAKSNMDKCIQKEQEKNYEINMKPYIQEVSNAMSQVQSGFKKSNELHSRMKNISESSVMNYLGFGNIFNVMSLQAQVLISQLQDVFGKMGAVSISIMYIMNGFSYTVASLRNTPFGKFLGLKTDTEQCFHPDTKIRVDNGNYVPIRDIKIGDTLYSGTRVIATLKIIGNRDDPSNPYFALYSHELKSFIYVTGTHYIEDDNRIIQVKYHPLAVVEKNIVSSEMYCLVTEDHYIPIGEHRFMDWEY